MNPEEPATRDGENWNRAYAEAPELFDAFCRAEDPDGAITRRLLEAADLAGRSVLELGCGTGRYTREWAVGASRYLAVERSPPMLALARARCAGGGAWPAFVCADAERLPLADGAVDRVLAAWVVANQPARRRRALLDEAWRVASRRPGAGVWLVENHWSGAFQALRGRAGRREEERMRRLIATHGFRVVDVVRSRLAFPAPEEAERVLGYLCGERVRLRLRRRPVAELSHHVLILHRARPAPGAGSPPPRP